MAENYRKCQKIIENDRKLQKQVVGNGRQLQRITEIITEITEK